MFEGCRNLEGELSVNLIKAVHTSSIFNECVKLTHLSINQTPEIQNATSMFRNCEKLTTISGRLILNTHNILAIFHGCTSLVDVQIEGLKETIELQGSPNLSVESVLHLFNHAQQVVGKTIRLHRKLEDKLEDEQIEIAVLKGWQVTFHG